MKCFGTLAVSLALFQLAGCSDGGSMSASPAPVTNDAQYELPPVVNPGGVSGLNYTPSYIARFGITGENGMRGGGPNIWRVEEGQDGPAGGGAETCCIGIPEVWKPDMKVTIRWEAAKVMDGKTPGVHYMAEARIPQYARETAGMWAIFLPGDRVKVMVRDGNANGRNSLDARPTDDDPYVAQGVVDEEAERKAAERRRKNAEGTATARRRIAKQREAEAMEETGDRATELRREAVEERRQADVVEANAAEAEALLAQLLEREAAARRCKHDASQASADCPEGKAR